MFFIFTFFIFVHLKQIIICLDQIYASFLKMHMYTVDLIFSSNLCVHQKNLFDIFRGFSLVVYGCVSRSINYSSRLPDRSGISQRDPYKWPNCSFSPPKSGLGSGFKYFLFSPLPGEMIQFDSYFSNVLKPPTSVNFHQLEST